MVFTRLAVLLATSLADWTKCLLATGLAVLDEAMRQALHKAEVCLATIVAADRTYKAWNGVGGIPHFSAEDSSLEESTLVPSPGFLSSSHVQGPCNYNMHLALPEVSPRKERARISKQERINKEKERKC